MAWHFYDPNTGVFTSQIYDGPERFLAACTPPGLAAYPVEGSIDYHAQRVDLASGTLTDYQPPAPSDEHVWNTQTRRWQLSPAEQSKRHARSAVLIRITALEMQQLRPLRELALGVGGARERLEAIDAEIAQLRGNL